MNEAWNITQSRLRKWQKSAGSAWELRRILSDSQHFKVVAVCAFKRAKATPEQLTWQDWWGFHLERLPEREGMQLLLDAWNKDVWSHMSHQVRGLATALLREHAEQAQLARDFSAALADVLAGVLSAPPKAGEDAGGDEPELGEPEARAESLGSPGAGSLAPLDKAREGDGPEAGQTPPAR